MYGFITKLLVSKQLKFEEGKITLLKQPMIFIPLDFYVEITKRALSSRNDMLKTYLDAWKAGVVFMNNVSKAYKMKKFEERYKIAMDLISMAGFGGYETLEFHKDEFSKFKITNNPIADAFRPSKVPVDHILRGFNAGGGTPVHERIINTVEIRCRAIDGGFCEHVNANTGMLKKMDKKLVESQLDLKFLLPKQKKFLKEVGIKHLID